MALPVASASAAPPASASAAPPPPPPPPPRPPRPPLRPGVPGSLAPDGGGTIATAGETLSCSAVPGATKYDFSIQVLSGGAFVAYWTYSDAAPSQTFYPQVHATTYRWRVRADVGAAAGTYSAYATFAVPEPGSPACRGQDCNDREGPRRLGGVAACRP